MSRVVQVPDLWWRITCESISHPIACVGVDNYYIWANRAFERLTGYSVTELRNHTWMDLTVTSDVVGDLASVRDVVAGTTESYSTRSRYRHKRGNEVPVDLTCWRFPPVVGEITCFIVEAIPERVTFEQLEALHQSCMSAIGDLDHRLKGFEMSKDSHRQVNTDTNVFNVGNKTDNATITKVFVSIVAMILAVVGYLIYIGGWNHHQGAAQPPTPIHTNP